jgi:hypothetical protein
VPIDEAEWTRSEGCPRATRFLRVRDRRLEIGMWNTYRPRNPKREEDMVTIGLSRALEADETVVARRRQTGINDLP